MLLFNWLAAVRKALRRSSLSSRRSRSSLALGKTAYVAGMVERLESRQLLTGIIPGSLQVTTSSDAVSHSGLSLRDAVTQANADGSGDTITFNGSLAGQTITLTQGELPLTGSMTINGLGASQLTIDGNNASRIFDIGNTTTRPSVSITGVTLQHGNGVGVNESTFGGAMVNYGKLTLANNAISGNSASIAGGIYNTYLGTLGSTNDTFSGNAGTNYYGGILNVGTMTMTNDTVSGNSGGNDIGGIQNSGTLTSMNDSVSGNSGSGIENDGTLRTTNDTISGNSAVGEGGGIFNTGTLIATNDTISGNSAGDQGGGIFNNDVTATMGVIDSIIVGNTESIGGDVSGTLSPSSSHNLIGIPIGQTLSGILKTDIGGKPLLANNGGPTQTIALTNIASNPAFEGGTALATVAAGGDGGTTLTVDSTTFLAVGDNLRVGTEIVTVTAVPTIMTVTVLRGQAGTTQANLNGLPVTLALDQRSYLRLTNDLGAVRGPQQVVTISGDTHVDGQTTLREAVQQANVDGSGDTVAFVSSLAGQTITLTQGELLLTGSMTITGLGAGQLTIDGNHASRIFEINNASSTPNVTIAGLTLQHGNGIAIDDNGDGGAIDNRGNLRLANDTISGNSAQLGGGIYNNGTLIATNDTISGNSTPSFGGGIYNGGTLTATNDTISGNSTQYGGGIYNAGILTATNDTISGNSTQFDGGGIFNVSTLSATNDTISGNSARSGGGIYNGGTFAATNDVIVGNTAPTNGEVVGSLTANSSHNLVGIPNGMTLANILQTDVGGHPLLANNGGPTQTIALANNPSNPAIGTGGALATVSASGDGGTILTVDATNSLAVGDSLRIGTEIVSVTAIPSVTTLMVLRGQAGTIQANLNGLAVSLAFDQRGLARNVNVDIGAFETQIPAVTNVVIASGVYTASAFAVTNATVTGVMNQTLASFGDPTLSYAYYAGTLAVLDLAGATPLSGAPINAGNYTVVAAYTSNVVGYRNATSSPVHFAITPATLTISAVTNTRVYDGTKSASATPIVSGLQGADQITGLTEHYTEYSALGTNNSVLRVDAGYMVVDGNGGANYTVVLPFALGTIAAAPLTISAVTNSKAYDSTTSANAKPMVSGLVAGDIISNATEHYSSPNVLGVGGSTLNVDGSFTIGDGNGGKNYTVTLNAITGTISSATLTIAAATNTKAYDGTKSASAAPIVSGLQGIDSVTGLTEHYTSYSALGINNSALRVDPGYSINDGNGGANYSVVLPFALGTITPATLTIAAVTNSRVYNGTKTANATPTVTGLITGDTVTGLTEHYSQYSALGTGNSVLRVDPGYSIADGNGGANYSVLSPFALGTITPAALTIAPSTSQSKIYDGMTNGNGSLIALSGLISGDTVTGTTAYASRNVMGLNGSTVVVVSYSIGDGNGGGNYTVTTQNGIGTITPAQLKIAAATNTKVYDGTKSAFASPIVTGLGTGDSVTGLTEHYNAYSVLGAVNSVLRVDPGYTINDGNGGANYTVVVPFALGTITPAALTIAPASQTKVYDGTTSATGSPIALSGLIPGDIVTGSTAFASKSVMGLNGSTLVVTGYSIGDGNGGKNYAVTALNGIGTITPVTLTIAAVTNTRVYDGTKSAAATPTVLGLITGDTVTGLTELYTTYSALGTNNNVLRVDPGYTVNDGNDGANYSVVSPFALGTITPAALTIKAVTFTKVYDGTTTANVTPSVTGLVTGDIVSNLTEHFMSPNAMGVNGSTLKVDPGYAIGDGNGGANYTVTVNSATGTITTPA